MIAASKPQSAHGTRRFAGERTTGPEGAKAARSSESRSKPTSAKRIDALDGVRGIAILMVMAFHASLWVVSQNVVDRYVLRAAGSLWFGVDLFFVLSGFLITGILLDSRESAHYFRNFYARRTLRIFPLYYGVLVAVLILLPAAVPRVRSMDMFQILRANQAWFWTYTTNIRVALAHSWDVVVPGRLNHFWSLAVEEQFYLLWPLVVLLVGRKKLLWVCVGVIVGALATRVGLILTDPGVAAPGMQYTTNVGAYLLLPARADTLAIGAAMACLIRGPGGYATLARYAKPVGWISTLGLVTLFLLRSDKLWEYNSAVQIVGYPLLGLAFAALVVKALDPERGRATRLFERAPLRRIGRYAYALYVFHYPLIYFLNAAHLGPERYLANRVTALPGYAVFFAVTFTLSMVIAAVSWRFYEAPILSLARFFREPRSADAAGPQSGSVAAVQPVP